MIIINIDEISDNKLDIMFTQNNEQDCYRNIYLKNIQRNIGEKINKKYTIYKWRK